MPPACTPPRCSFAKPNNAQPNGQSQSEAYKDAQNATSPGRPEIGSERQDGPRGRPWQRRSEDEEAGGEERPPGVRALAGRIELLKACSLPKDGGRASALARRVALDDARETPSSSSLILERRAHDGVNGRRAKRNTERRSSALRGYRRISLRMHRAVFVLFRVFRNGGRRTQGQKPNCCSRRVGAAVDDTAPRSYSRTLGLV